MLTFDTICITQSENDFWITVCSSPSSSYCTGRTHQPTCDRIFIYNGLGIQSMPASRTDSESLVFLPVHTICPYKSHDHLNQGTLGLGDGGGNISKPLLPNYSRGKKNSFPIKLPWLNTLMSLHTFFHWLLTDVICAHFQLVRSCKEHSSIVTTNLSKLWPLPWLLSVIRFFLYTFISL